jgi:hypothetical protein
MENMQAQQSHIGERQNLDVRLREQGVGRLEEAVLRDLPTLYKRGLQRCVEPQRIPIRCLDESVNTRCLGHKRFH